MKRTGFLGKSLLFLNILAGISLVLCITVRRLPTETFPVFAILSLLVPFVILCNVFFFLFWALARHKYFLISGVGLLLAMLVVKPFYKMGAAKKGISENDISIMTYNARNFAYNTKGVDSLILDLVTKEDPDIVCFQEFYYKMKRSKQLSQYPHKFIDFVYGSPNEKVIQAIYSKYPILNVAPIAFPKSSNSAVYADILVDKDTFRLYNLHLQSFSITPDFQHMEKQKYKRVISKMKKAMRLQKQQVDIVREHQAKSPYRTLIVGDFNATQFSNAYHTLTEGFSDSFFEAGKGFGRTYDLKGYPMRIDYILGDEHIEFTSHTNYDHRYSDHYPVKASFRLVENK